MLRFDLPTSLHLAINGVEVAWDVEFQVDIEYRERGDWRIVGLSEISSGNPVPIPMQPETALLAHILNLLGNDSDLADAVETAARDARHDARDMRAEYKMDELREGRAIERAEYLRAQGRKGV